MDHRLEKSARSEPAGRSDRNKSMYQLSANNDQFRMKARESVQPRTLIRKRAGETVSVQKDQESREDEALLIAVGNSQDREAFNALFHRFSGKIFALGMKITRNDQLANDLVQEAMLIIWQKAPLYDLDKGSAQTWIFTLVRNRCFDILRKMKRQPEGISADDIYAETEYELSVDPEQEQSTLIQMDQISQYFELLPAAQREVIEYVFMRDLTHQEAAQQLDIPLGTLKSRLRLALNKLRDYIGVEE